MHTNYSRSRRALLAAALGASTVLSACASSSDRATTETIAARPYTEVVGESAPADTAAAAYEEQPAGGTAPAAATFDEGFSRSPSDPTNVESSSSSNKTGQENLWDQPVVTQVPAGVDVQARDAGVNPETQTRADNQSTFAMDVDTGSYTLARALIEQGQLPQYDSVRTEEFVNYFDQQYQSPRPGNTFAIHVDGTAAPFLSSDKRIIRIGIQGRRVEVADRKPVRLTFVVDNSGSMSSDDKLTIVKGALRTLTGELDRGDKVAIVGFSDNAWVSLPPTNGAQRDVIINAVDSMSTVSSTNAEAGLRLGYEQAQAMFDPQATNRVILLSDGVANVGPDGPEAILREIGDFARRDIDLNTIGVGTDSYNDEMMERLADTGDGTYAYIDSQQEADRIFRTQFTSTIETIARGAKVQVEFDSRTIETYRLLGFENRAIADGDFTNNRIDAGELGAGHSVTALYEVTLANGRDRNGGNFGTVRLRWEEPDGQVRSSDSPIEANTVSPTFSKANPYLRLDVVAAAYAEVLRKSPWSQLIDLATVASNAQRLVDSGEPFQGSKTIVEFARLTKRAAEMAR